MMNLYIYTHTEFYAFSSSFLLFLFIFKCSLSFSFVPYFIICNGFNFYISYILKKREHHYYIQVTVPTIFMQMFEKMGKHLQEI